MRNTKKLLELLHREFPTSDGVRHNITLASVPTIPSTPIPAPPETRLLITVWVPVSHIRVGWNSKTFFLTDADYGKTPEQVVLDIKQFFANLKAEDEAELKASEHPDIANRIADLFGEVHIGNESVNTLTVNPKDAHLFSPIFWGAEVKTDEKIRKGHIILNKGEERPLY